MNRFVRQIDCSAKIDNFFDCIYSMEKFLEKKSLLIQDNLLLVLIQHIIFIWPMCDVYVSDALLYL